MNTTRPLLTQWTSMMTSLEISQCSPLWFLIYRSLIFHTDRQLSRGGGGGGGKCFLSVDATLKLCCGFRHSSALQESFVYVGRRRRGRCRTADRTWSSSKWPCESQRWCLLPQSCMHRPGGPRCAAASQRPPVTTRLPVPSAVLCVCNVPMHLYHMCILSIH